MADHMKETVLERNLAASQNSPRVRALLRLGDDDLYGGTIWFEDSDSGGTVACLAFKAAE